MPYSSSLLSEAMEDKPVLDLWPFSALGLVYQTYPCLCRSPFGLTQQFSKSPIPSVNPTGAPSQLYVAWNVGWALL